MRIWKADIHGVMDRLEDQELLLRQYLREMENSLQEKEQRIVDLTENIKYIQADLATRHKEIDKLERDLAVALRKENDPVATLLIRKQLVQQNYCEHLARNSSALLEEQQQLTALLDEQQVRYELLSVQASSFCQRSGGMSAGREDLLTGTCAGVNAIDEDEIEIELIRRKEQLASEGDIL